MASQNRRKKLRRNIQLSTTRRNFLRRFCEAMSGFAKLMSMKGTLWIVALLVGALHTPGIVFRRNISQSEGKHGKTYSENIQWACKFFLTPDYRFILQQIKFIISVDLLILKQVKVCDYFQSSHRKRVKLPEMSNVSIRDVVLIGSACLNSKYAYFGKI